MAAAPLSGAEAAGASGYLLAAVGPLLARGMAATVTADPVDPVEYLGTWLLHQLQLQEVNTRRTAAAEAAARRHQEWEAGQRMRREAAAGLLQRHFRLLLARLAARREAERRLRGALAVARQELAAGLSARLRFDAPDWFEDLSDEERRVIRADAHAAVLFHDARTLLRALDSTVIGAVKRLRRLPPAAATVLRCALYCLGAKPRQVARPAQLQFAVKPSAFVRRLAAFEPTRPRNRRVVTRVRRILRGVDPATILEGPAAIGVLHEWCRRATEFQAAHEAAIEVKREAGVEFAEGDEDDDDGEESDPEDRDPDEEAEKLREEEEQRRRAAEEAEQQRDGDDDEDDDG